MVAMSRHIARRTSGPVVGRSVVIREAGYRTRVSAKRDLAGCATERFVAIGWLTRRTKDTHARSARGRENIDASEARLRPERR
jgi:hypothetical protein